MIGYHHDGIDAFQYAAIEARWNDHHNTYLDVVAIDDCDELRMKGFEIDGFESEAGTKRGASLMSQAKTENKT